MNWFLKMDMSRKYHYPYGPHWRKLTVPGTAKRKYSLRGYRYPHTRQEIAYNAIADDEEARYYKIKKPRRTKQIPTAWDDIWFHTQRNWKSFRKTRWK